MKGGSRGLLAGAEGTPKGGDAKAGRVRLSFNPQLRVKQLGLAAPSSGRATSTVRTAGIRCSSLASTATTARMARPSSAARTPRLPCRSSTRRSNARRFGTRSASRPSESCFLGWASSSPSSRDNPRRRPFPQPARDGGAVDPGGQSRHPVDPALLPPLSRQRGPVAARDRRARIRHARCFILQTGRGLLDSDTLSADPWVGSRDVGGTLRDREPHSRSEADEQRL